MSDFIVAVSGAINEKPPGGPAALLAGGPIRRRAARCKRRVAPALISGNSQAGVSLFGNSFREKAEWGTIFRDGGFGNMSQGMDDSATRASGPDCCIAERD